jgi:5-methylcytosine-specific restriction endonuclease McrA
MKQQYSLVHYVPVDAHQAGSMTLLWKHYAELDNRIYNWKSWLRIRERWMRDQENLYGEANLTCSICGKNGLDPWSKDKKTLATIDHILPIGRYPHLWAETSNFQIACGRCNQKKGCN